MKDPEPLVQPFNDEYFMRRALDEARQAAAEGEVPVGAVIVCNDRIIARAHNQTERLNDPKCSHSRPPPVRWVRSTCPTAGCTSPSNRA